MMELNPPPTSFPPSLVCSNPHMAVPVKTKSYVDLHTITKSLNPDDCETVNLDEHSRGKECDEFISLDFTEKISVCFEAITQGKIARSVTENGFVRFIKRLMPLFAALWVKMDMVLDGRQTIVYFDHGFSHGVYKKWALDYQNTTNSTYLQSVSKGYFETASVIWIASPLLFSILMMIGDQKPMACVTRIASAHLNYEINLPDGKWCAIVLGVALLPVDFFAAFFLIYIGIPIIALKRGLIVAWTGEDYDETTEIMPDFYMKDLPGSRAIEFLGEALPQLTLAIIFTANNYPFLSETQSYFGVTELTISLVSMLFSTGSLCFGLYNDSPRLYKFVVKKSV